jgi:hypothetical protein
MHCSIRSRCSRWSGAELRFRQEEIETVGRHLAAGNSCRRLDTHGSSCDRDHFAVLAYKLTFERSIHADLRQEHRSAILGGVGQHLNGKPPFGGITLYFGEVSYKVVGFSQSFGRSSSE